MTEESISTPNKPTFKITNLTANTKDITIVVAGKEFVVDNRTDDQKKVDKAVDLLGNEIKVKTLVETPDNNATEIKGRVAAKISDSTLTDTAIDVAKDETVEPVVELTALATGGTVKVTITSNGLSKEVIVTVTVDDSLVALD